MKKIYLIKNGQNAGPYNMDEVQSRLNSGAYAESDLAWYEGCDNPIPLGEVMRLSFSTRANSETSEFSRAELMHISLQQKGFLSTVLVCLGLIPLSMMVDLGEVERPIFIAAGMMSLGYGWRLARALRKNPWIWTVLLLLPFVCWIMDARLIWLAIKTLKANGIPCGIFGADQAAVNLLAKKEAI